MAETFTPTVWADGPGGGTPITAAQLNRLEQGVESMDDRVAELEDTATVIEGNAQSASYTLALADAGKNVEMDSTSANTLTVPTDASVAFPVGTVVAVSQVGSGKTSIAPAAGVSLVPPLADMQLGSTVRLRKRAANQWGMSGDTGIRWATDEPFGTWYDPAKGDTGFIVNNNVWNTEEAGPQTIYAAAWNRWAILSNQPGAGSDDSVKAYADSQKVVSIALTGTPTVPSTFDVSTPSAGGAVVADTPQWNAAYDMWLNDFAIEVMVWTNWTMNWQFHYTQNSGTQITVDGVLYNAWTDGDSGIWFVRDTVTNSGSVDLGHVLSAAITQGWLTTSDVLNHIEYGFEVCYTGGEALPFVLNDFTA